MRKESLCSAPLEVTMTGYSMQNKSSYRTEKAHRTAKTYQTGWRATKLALMRHRSTNTPVGSSKRVFSWSRCNRLVQQKPMKQLAWTYKWRQN